MENYAAIFPHKIRITDLILMKIATQNFKKAESWIYSWKIMKHEMMVYTSFVPA